MTSPRRIVLVQFSARRDGSAMSALLLADGLRAAGWDTHVAFAAPGPMERAFEEKGHALEIVPHKNWLRAKTSRSFLRNVLRERQAVPEMRACIERIRPAVVYVNTGASVVGVWAARKAGIPVIWHLRELFDDVGGELVAPDAWYPWVRRRFRRWADRLVVNSAAVGKNLLGREAHRASVVPNAVDDAFFDESRTEAEARADLGLPLEGSIIGVPGTLRPMKGHPFFLQAVAPLLQRHPEAQVAVSGGGEGAYVASLRRQVAELGIERQVHFLGIVTDMAAFYRASTVVCVPSRAEPFGRTVIEAFAVGVPVVASAVGGILEIVDDHATGRLVPYGDGGALERVIADLLHDRSQRALLGACARRTAEARYRASTYQRRLLELIDRSLQEGRD